MGGGVSPPQTREQGEEWWPAGRWTRLDHLGVLGELAAHEGRERFVAHEGALLAAFDAAPGPGGADFFREHFFDEPGPQAPTKPV